MQETKKEKSSANNLDGASGKEAAKDFSTNLRRLQEGFVTPEFHVSTHYEKLHCYHSLSLTVIVSGFIHAIECKIVL